MIKYNFNCCPSDACKIIHTNNFNVYLDTILLCSHVYSIMISYTGSGKHLNMYDNNGNRIYSHLLSDSIIRLSYYQSFNSINFRSEY